MEIKKISLINADFTDFFGIFNAKRHLFIDKVWIEPTNGLIRTEAK